MIVEAGDGRERREIVEPGFDDGGARAGDGAVALAVRRMLRAAFGESVRQEVGVVLGEEFGERHAN